jgi:hypothetical protein
MSKKTWRKPEVKQISAGSAEQPTKNGVKADAIGSS